MLSDLRLFFRGRLAVVVAALVVASTSSAPTVRASMKDQHQKTLTVIFPFGTLLPDQRIVDPENLDITYQYYLLENLAVGLVRDGGDKEGYRAGLAESWHRIDERTWAFTLAPNLRWSNGAKIRPGELTRHFEMLKASKSRHVVHLRHLKLVETDLAGTTILFHFDGPIGDGLLHELSLADTALRPADSKGWKVTSGPYSVEAYDPAGKTLMLVTNQHCPISTDDAPQRVMLRGLQDKSDMAKVFADIEADLVYAPTPSFRRDNALLRERAGQEYVGMPTLIHFLYFNGKNALAMNQDVRRELASLLDAALESGPLPGRLSRETQVIPLGYPGRLKDYQVPRVASRVLAGRKITIRVNPWFKEAPGLTSALTEVASRAGVTIDFKYEAYSGTDGLGDDFAQILSFAGNQHDPSGTWGFLFSEGRGPLGPFAGDARALMEAAEAASNGPQRDEMFEALHQRALKDVYLIPLFSEPMSLLGSDKLDLSRLSRFDMRLRLYEMRWR